MARHEFLISAAHKSSGKTIVSIGLIRALCDRGLDVQPGKKGPDYIDPMWLSAAANRPCYNYDFNTQAHDEIQQLFAATDADVRMIEGNKGLYDSVDVEGRYSNAALARLLRLPVVLVLDVHGITRGVAPLLQGYRDFEAVTIAGVILNNVATPRHESKLRAAIEQYTRIPVLGAVPRTPDLVIPERHLGLVPTNEHEDCRGILDRIAATVKRSVDLDKLLDLTRVVQQRAFTALADDEISGEGITLGVARDEAFGFYYADDLDRFAASGMRVEFFSPLHGDVIPDCDALFIGGGFPESFAARLSANVSMRESVRRFAEAGGIVYAECGGLMYLCDSLQLGAVSHAMAGVIAASTRMRERPVGRGLVRIAPNSNHPWSEGGALPAVVDAHEFHYSELLDLKQSQGFAYDVIRGYGANGDADGIVVGHTLASFAHQRHTRANPWLRNFVNYIHRYKSKASHVNQAY